eukprot:9418052-Pyramimonas_sp.AAC.1
MAQGVHPPPGLHIAPQRPVGAQGTGSCGGGQDLKGLTDAELQSLEQLGAKSNNVQLTNACQQERVRRHQPGRAAHDVAGEAHAKLQYVEKQLWGATETLERLTKQQIEQQKVVTDLVGRVEIAKSEYQQAVA